MVGVVGAFEAGTVPGEVIVVGHDEEGGEAAETV